jgi:hypothetical protein
MGFVVELLTLPVVALVLPGLAHATDGGAAPQAQVAGRTAIAGEAGTVEGMVLARGSRQGAKGRQVFMKGRAPVTIRDGGFSFANVASPYDVTIAEPIGDTISIYQGLTRRDPVLWFHTGYTSASHDSPHQATIHGILRGDFPFPVDRNHGVTVHFLSDRAQSFWRADPPEQHTNSAGPRFGRMRVSWEGAPTMPGQLVAVGQHAVDKKKWVDAYVGRAPLTLTAGQEAIQEVTMQPVAIGRIAGSVSIDNKDMVREIGFGYQLPGMSGRVGLGTCPVYKTFDCELPDLSALGGEYCAFISYSFIYDRGHGQTTRCGGKLGMTDFSFRVGPPPNLKQKDKPATMTSDGTLSWTDADKGVYMVTLASEPRKRRLPHITVFTSATSIHWPDFEALGSKFPVGAKYTCQVTRLSPYESVDDLASPRGFTQTADFQKVESLPLELTLVQRP